MFAPAKTTNVGKVSPQLNGNVTTCTNILENSNSKTLQCLPRYCLQVVVTKNSLFSILNFLSVLNPDSICANCIISGVDGVGYNNVKSKLN